MSEKIKVGIIGLGRAGHQMHSREIAAHSEQFEVGAVCDIDPERAERIGAELKSPHIYTDYKELLKDKSIELVVVATYSLEHVKHAIEALEAGYYVIIEKPLAIDYATVQKLKEVSDRHPGKLFCRQNRRFEPAFQHVKEILASGLLGDIALIKLRRNSFSRRNDWQTLKSNGGGQLNNWGPHLIDHALQFLNYNVDSVWGDLKQIAAMGDADDSVKILLKGNHGMTVDIEIFGGAALTSNTYEIYGTRGAIAVTPDEQDIIFRYVDPTYELKEYPVTQGHPTDFSFADNATIPWIRKTIMVAPSNHIDMSNFYTAIYDTMRNGKPFPITLEQAMEVVRISDEIKKQNPQFR